MTDFEKCIEFKAAFSKRDPDPKKDYGIHGVEAYFVLIGPAGAISFTLYTGWQLPEVVCSTEDAGLEGWRYGKALVEAGHYPMGATVSYHARVQRGDAEVSQEHCEWLNGDPCYSDGTFIADDAFEALIRGGSDGIWEYLEGWYRSHLEGREQ